MMMKTVAFMPIKLNNERVPGKNLKPMDDGKILISFMLETLFQVKKDGIVDDIVVFCSSEKIKEYLPDYVNWVRRPEILDSQKATSNDIIREFLKVYNADLYAMCHATSPFIRKEHIEECINAVKSGKFDSAFSGKKIQNFMWKNNSPLNFERSCYPRTQDLEPIYEELPTPYVFSRKVFEETGGRTGRTPYIAECSNIEAIDIDNPEDFELANRIYMSGLYKKDL